MNRKAQLVNNIIIFVVGLIVIGLVLLFGYSTIQSFSEDRCDVIRLQFGTDLNTAIDRNKNWGANRVAILNAPCQAAHICFVDRRIVDTDNFGNDIATFATNIDVEPYTQQVRQVINDSVWVNQGIGEAQRDYTNVFSVTEDGEIQPLERYSTQAAAIRVIDDSEKASAACHPVRNGRLEIRMQGNGETARVRAVET